MYYIFYTCALYWWDVLGGIVFCLSIGVYFMVHWPATFCIFWRGLDSWRLVSSLSSKHVQWRATVGFSNVGGAFGDTSACILQEYIIDWQISGLERKVTLAALWSMLARYDLRHHELYIGWSVGYARPTREWYHGCAFTSHTCVIRIRYS